MADTQPQAALGQNTALGCSLRVFWMVLGNAVPIYSAIWIVKERTPLASPIDLVFWAGILSVVFTRYLDVAYFQGRTSTGEPATLAHWRSHALLAFVIGGVAFAGAHGLAMLLAR